MVKRSRRCLQRLFGLTGDQAATSSHPTFPSGDDIGGDDDGDLLWERHYKPRTLGIGCHCTWEVASWLGRPEMGMNQGSG